MEISCSFNRGPGGDYLVIAIGDDGIGMSDQTLARAFEPFFQGDASSTKTREGAGMGLAVVAALCRALDAAIGIESKLGEGSCFTLRVPLDAAPADVATGHRR